ncbi:MAG: ribosome silencing factor [Bacteroidia bacterium]
MIKKKEEVTKKATAKTPLKKAAKKVVKKTASKKPVVKKEVKKPVVKKLVVKKAPAKKANKAVEPKSLKIKKDAIQLLADAAVEGILEVKGRNISILNLTTIHNRVCDYFIICQADSNTQVSAIAGSVEEIVKKLTGERPYRKEGLQNSEWVLIDYVTVVVHVFQSQIRNFYNLESLWADAEVTELAFD